MRKLIRYFAYLRGFHAIEARSLRANIQHHELQVRRLSRDLSEYQDQMNQDVAELKAMTRDYEARLLALLGASAQEAASRQDMDAVNQTLSDPARLQELLSVIHEAKAKHERLLSRCYQRQVEMERQHRNLEAELERREQVIRDGFLHPGLHYEWRQRYRNNLRARESFEHSIADSLTRVNKASDKFTRRVGFMEEHPRIKQGVRAAA